VKLAQSVDAEGLAVDLLAAIERVARGVDPPKVPSVLAVVKARFEDVEGAPCEIEVPAVAKPTIEG
jgi:hypothetical protein